MIAQKSPKKEEAPSLTWEGRKLPMELTVSGWRVRSRSRHFPIDYCTNIRQLKPAKAAAKKHLEGLAQKAAVKPRSKHTLQDVVDAYLLLPKRAGEDAVKVSVYRLIAIVRMVTGKKLDEVPSDAINAQFWLDYIAGQQGRPFADLATRSPRNGAINSAMKAAAAIFKPSLRPLYAAQGIVLSPEVTTIQWLTVMKLARPDVDSDGLAASWLKLKSTDPAKWLCIGLARYAGMRRDEIENMTRRWVEIDGAAVYVRISDRPDQGWNNKTGENYRAVVIHPEVAAVLRGLVLTCGPIPGGDFVVKPKLTGTGGRPYTRAKWFKSVPQAWAKEFTGTARKPLHRLRGLYADDLAKMTEDAVKARLEGVKAASEALGHTSTKTTQDHYLAGDQVR